MSKTQLPPTAIGVPAQPGRGPVTVPRALSARRRSRSGIALSLVLIALGGAGSAVLWQSSGQREAVVSVVAEVEVGQVITRQDLGEASMALDPAVKAVPASRIDEVVGKRASVELKPGTLLSASHYTDKALVEAGEHLVPVALKSSRMPATPLAAGLRVQLVTTPAEGAEDAPGDLPDTIAARVVQVGSPAPGTGEVIVDVAVPATDGPVLAARAAAGRIALVVETAGS